MRSLLLCSMALLCRPAAADATLPAPRAASDVAKPEQEEGPFPSPTAICTMLIRQLSEPGDPIDGDNLPPRAVCTVRRLSPRLAALELRAPDEFLSPAYLPIDDELRVALLRGGRWWLTPEHLRAPDPRPATDGEQPRLLDFAKVERELAARYRRVR